MKKSRIILCVLVMLCYACEEIAPPELPIVSVSASDITPNSAVVTATASPKGATQTTGVLYGTDANLQSPQEAASALTSLTSNTTYYYKGYAADKMNNRIYSDVKSFKTLEETLNVSTTSIAAKVEAGTYTFDITSNVSWTVSSDQTWCTVQPASGSGNSTVTLATTGNTSVSSRTAVITVKSGSISKQVTLAQGEAILNVSTTSIPAQAAAGSYNFNISSNTSWTVQSDQTWWCTVLPVSGSRNGTITITLLANSSGNSRTATITVSSSSLTRTITITQSTIQVSDDIKFGNGITPAASFGGGDGTQNNPYLISTPRQLKKLVDDVKNMHTYGGTYFRLNTDIHVTADEWVPIGLGENWAPFHGNFDGGEHTISGVIKSNKYAYFGFFGYIYYSRISSLKIAATVKSEYSGTSDYEPTTGGIAGYCEGAIISNSHVTGNVTGGNTKENEFVQPSETGGIVGFNWGNITDCTVSSTITGGRSNRSSTGGITGTNYGHIANCTVAASGRVIGSGNSSEYVGGIVGIIFGSSILVSEISNCTNHATIISTGIGSYAGGLVGSNNPQGATIHTSLNTGNISGSGYVGGLVGGNVSYFSGSTYYGYVYSCCTNTGLVNGQPATNANQIGYGGGVEPCPDGHTKR